MSRLRVVFLGCGFITRTHSRHLRALTDRIEVGYASRDLDRAERFRAEFGGFAAYGDYAAALADASVDAVVIAVPPVLHKELTTRALAAGKHVLVEKPAYPLVADFDEMIAARDRAGRVVLVGENDHYKPLVGTLRRLLASDVIGELVMTSIVTIADIPKETGDWRNDEAMAGGDAFFEEGIHWLHVAGSLGPRITRVSGHRPALARDVDRLTDRRSRSMVVAFDYDTGAVGSLLYSREVPSLLRGIRVSKLFGRRGVITFESNGGVVVVRGRGLPRVVTPGFKDIRGYQAMYADLHDSIRSGRQPEMSLERAREDQVLMEVIRDA